MTEELITQLAPIDSLKVISRTSVMQYKGTKKTIPQIARELGVGGIVEGSVMRSGDRVRIIAQLIEAASDRHLWAQSYERDLKDVLALQREVARDITAHIRLSLSPAQSERLTARAEVEKQVQQALRLNPGYPGAHLIYNVLLRATGRHEQSIAEARRAIELDPLSLINNYDLAWSYYQAHQFDEALAQVRRTLEIDPHFSMALV